MNSNSFREKSANSATRERASVAEVLSDCDYVGNFCVVLVTERGQKAYCFGPDEKGAHKEAVRACECFGWEISM